MNAPLAYGIDFGTTNSVLAIAYPDRTEAMTDHGVDLLRSVIYLDRRGTKTAGEQALRQFLSNPDVNKSRVILDLKRSLADEHLEATRIFGHTYSLQALTSIVFRYLKLLGDRWTGSDTRRAVIGFPVAFPDALGDHFATRQDLALDRLCEAANLAGFDEIVPLEEPAAAAAGEAAELYATLDFGGGTFDVAIVRQHPEEDEVLALTGVPVGGEELTARLFALAVAPALGLDHRRVPARYRNATRSLSSLLTMLFEGDLSAGILREHAPLFQQIREGGFLYDLYAAVESAKRQLSHDEQATVRLNKRGFEQLHVMVERAAFEEAIREQIEATMVEFDRAVSAAGITASDLDLVTLTGGSSRIPLFREAIRERAPDAKIEDRDPYGRVAQGLAEQARVYPW